MKKASFVVVAAGLCLAWTTPASAARSCTSIAASYYGPQYFGSIGTVIQWFGGKIFSLAGRNDCQL